MIQIAIFATIPVKAARARPRAAFHVDLPGAQKFKADPEQNPRAQKAFKSSRKKSSFQLFLQNKINSRKRERKSSDPRPPQRTWSRDVISRRVNFCSRLTGKIGNPDNENIFSNGSLFLYPKSRPRKWAAFLRSVISDQFAVIRMTGIFETLKNQLSSKLCIDRDSGNGTRGGGAAQMI